MHAYVLPFMLSALLCAATSYAQDAAPPVSAVPAQTHAPIKPTKEEPVKKPEEDFVYAELLDGSEVKFSGDGHVFIVTPDGKSHVPPDGLFTLKDGVTFTVEGGIRTQQ